MKTVVGLGQAGCKIAEIFMQYPQYKVLRIDVGIEGKRCLSLKKYNNPEEYEQKCPPLKTFFRGVRGDVLFITSCGTVSGVSLRILKELEQKKCKLHVMYIKPDRSLLSHASSLQENLVFNVFQEYARSAVFETLYLVKNEKIVDIIGDIPIRQYYDKINDFLASAVHMINVFKNSKSEINTFSPSVPTAKISTFGVVDFESGKERTFFDLQHTREKKYFYAIPEKKLQSDGTLMKKITEQVKNAIEHDKMRTSYGVYSTNYKDPYVYSISNSSFIQKNEKNA
jgi:hypothetical protein